MATTPIVGRYGGGEMSTDPVQPSRSRSDVYGADLVPGSALAARYEPLIVGRPAFISFQMAAELRYGAILRGWGRARMLKLDTRINTAEIVHTRSRPVRRVRTPPRRLPARGARPRPARAQCRSLDRRHRCPPRHSPRLKRPFLRERARAGAPVGAGRVATRAVSPAARSTLRISSWRPSAWLAEERCWSRPADRFHGVKAADFELPGGASEVAIDDANADVVVCARR
jgi:hypothetical protein